MSKLKKYRDKKGNSVSHLYRDEMSGIFWAVIRVGNKIRKKSLQTTSYLEALNFLPRALEELGKETPKEKNAPAKLIKEYIEDLRKEKVANETRDATLKKFDSIVKNHINPYFGNLRPDQIHKGIISDFLIWYRERSDGQVFNIYKYLGNIFHFMLKAGAITPDQMPELKLPKSEKRHHDKKKGRVITDEEREALRKHGSDRAKLIIGLGDILGMRKMEIGALEKKRIYKKNGRYFIILTEDDTKTGLPRVLGVPKSLEHLLEKAIKASGDSRFLFPAKRGDKHIPAQIIDKEWKAVKQAAGIKGRLRFHDLRHSRATEFAKRGVNPAIACTILGMSLRMYQKVYLNLSDEDLLNTIDLIDEVSV